MRQKQIKLWMLICVLVMLPNCTTVPTQISPTATAIPRLPSITPTAPDQCAPPPVAKPTMPAVIPGYTQLDESTGLHMTGEVQQIDLADYQLQVTGKVDHPLSFTFDELRCLPKQTANPVLICPGYFEDVATWSGASLSTILDMAGVQGDAKSVYLVSIDGYEAYLTVEEASRKDNFLAYEWEGEPLPVLHGFPVRAIIPSLYGSKWTKWLVEIRVE